MDGYFGSVSEDLAVPKDEEIFDRLPSPDSWSSWDDIVGNFNSPEKLNALGVEEFLLSEAMFFGAPEQRSPSSICQGSRHTFRELSACPDEHSDVELSDLPMIDEADDIFFNSIFEVDARALEEADCSANCTQTSSEDDVMEVVDLVGGRNHIQDGIDNDENVRHFLPEKEWEVEICALEEKSNVFEDISEEDVSMEESVLLELQGLTVQLANKTRICFRDSLYRLAENSRSQCSWNGKEDLENCKTATRVGPSRLRESRAKDSDTNAIDRTVATLLFDNMKFSNPSATSTSCQDAETLQREYQVCSGLYHPSSSLSSRCTVPGGDAEVPTFGITNQPSSPPRDHTSFSTTPVMWS